MHKLIKPREAAGLTLCTHLPPERESSERATLPGCSLCLPPSPTRPFLMKLDCLSCSVIPPILSTGVLYNSLMVIVTNKSPPLPASYPIFHLTPWPDRQFGSQPGCTEACVWWKRTTAHAQAGRALSPAPFNHSCNVMKHAVIKHSSGGCSGGISSTASQNPLQQPRPQLSAASHSLQTPDGELSSVPPHCLVASVILIKHVTELELKHTACIRK